MPGLVAKSLGFAAAVVLAYCVAVQWTQPRIARPTSQYLGNRIAIEDFLYRDDIDVVLTGSSLTRVLPSNVLGPRAANVAVSAGDALTGLRIVLESDRRPRRILVEINKIDLGVDETLVSDVLAEPMYSLRKHVAAFRLGYQPMNLLFNLLRGTAPGRELQVTPEARRRGIDRNRAASGIPLPEADMAGNISALKELAAKARSMNVEIVFYEMPVDPQVWNLARPRQIRDAVRAAFPPTTSCWLYPSLSEGPHTLDGLHLIVRDARTVAAQLRAAPVCHTARP